MTSSYSGPYQSRVFRFLSQHSRRFLDTCERGWRRVKVTADQVAQYALYPLYVLLQLSRQIGKPMGQASATSSLPETTSDLEVPGNPVAQSHPSSPFNLQPLADAQLFPPIRHFWQVMAWVQTSSLAVRVNLFEEATFVSLEPSPSDFDSLFRGLDRVIATWEAKDKPQVLKITPTLKSYSEITHRGTGFFQRLKENVSHLVVEPETALKTDADDTTDVETGHIKALILAALRYFFGDKGATSFANPNEQNLSVLASDSQANFDLAGEFPLAQLREAPAPSTLPGEVLTETPKCGKETPILSGEGTISWATWRAFATPAPAVTAPQNKPETITVSKATTPMINSPVSVPAVVHSVLSQGAGVTIKPQFCESVPEYWEIKATSVEYVKHPLEQLLSWLDQGMVWLEKVITKIWQWFQEKKSHF